MFNSRLTRRNFYYIIGAAAVIVAAALLAVLISPDKEPDTEELPDEFRTALSVSEVTKVNPGKEKLEYIKSHPELYPDELISLAERNEEAIDFVYQYPDLGTETAEIDLSGVDLSKIPHFLQWDARWGYMSYSGNYFACTGCGPTCLSMAAVYLTGNRDYSPACVAEFAEKEGYSEGKDGTAWSLMSDGCRHFGIYSKEVPLDEKRMAEALNAGMPIICVLGPGDFTQNGHYIVITGYDDGAFTVNDPNSLIRSRRTWTFDELQGQIRNIWAFSTEDSSADEEVMFFVAE